MHPQQTAFENIVGKGEIARNKQFLLFLQSLLLNQIIVSPFVHIFDIMSLFAAELEKPKIGISGNERVNSLPNDKIVDLSILRAFADDIMNRTEQNFIAINNTILLANIIER